MKEYRTCNHAVDNPMYFILSVMACGCIRKTTFEVEGKSKTITYVAADMCHEASHTRLCGIAVCPLKRHLVYSSSTGEISVLNLCEDTWTPHIMIDSHVSTVKVRLLFNVTLL
jgi:hypothetical protein